jgi:hypothetical protein
MTDVTDLLEGNLLRVFGNRDAASRAAAVQELYAEDVVFIDPDETVVGREALDRKAAAILAGVPEDVEFAEEGPRYLGDGFGALAWRLGPAESPIARGIDVLTVRDGRITEVRTGLAR